MACWLLNKSLENKTEMALPPNDDEYMREKEFTVLRSF